MQVTEDAFLWLKNEHRHNGNVSDVCEGVGTRASTCCMKRRMMHVIMVPVTPPPPLVILHLLLMALV